MTTKKYIALSLLVGFLFISLHASEKDSPKKEKSTMATMKKTMCTILNTCKKRTINFIKKHPYITTLIIVTIVSKKMRSLPKNIWKDTQEQPLAIAFLGAIILNYLLN